MASNRIAYNPSANPNAGTAAKLRQVVSALQEGRKGLDELKRLMDKYNGDFAALAADLGAGTSADAQAIYNLVAQAQGDVGTVTTTAYTPGSPTGARQLVDALG